MAWGNTRLGGCDFRPGAVEAHEVSGAGGWGTHTGPTGNVHSTDGCAYCSGSATSPSPSHFTHTPQRKTRPSGVMTREDHRPAEALGSQICDCGGHPAMLNVAVPERVQLPGRRHCHNGKPRPPPPSPAHAPTHPPALALVVSLHDHRTPADHRDAVTEREHPPAVHHDQHMIPPSRHCHRVLVR